MRLLRWGQGLLATAIFAAWAAHAGPAHPHGPHEYEAKGPVLTLQASASSQVMQDNVTITLAAEITAPTQAEVASQLTERVNATLKQAGKPADIRVRNGSWRVWPNTDRDGRITDWRGRAEVVLESREIAAAADLAMKLSEQMAIANISFDLSPEARAAEEARLLKEVAAAFSQRAQEAATAFGFEGYTIRKLDLGGSGLMPMPRGEAMMFRMAAASADAAPPQLEPGETTVSLSVQGEVALQPKPGSEPRPAP